MDTLIRISAGQLEATIAPDLGGAILSFRELSANGDYDWLRPAPDNCTDILQTACYPLVPFSNRIDHGKFKWRGRQIDLAKNFSPEPHTIHGHGWKLPWTVDKHDADHLVMTLRYDAKDWPWSYEARQDIKISPDCLHVTLSITNCSDEPMPAGIGLHPFFPGNDQTRLKANVTAIQLNGEDGLPLELQKAHPTIAALNKGDKRIYGLDNAFEGWEGVALIEWQGQSPMNQKSLKIISEAPLRHLVIYTPEHADYFCVEPVSHLNGVFTSQSGELAMDGGLVELSPGATLKAKTIFCTSTM